MRSPPATNVHVLGRMQNFRGYKTATFLSYTGQINKTVTSNRDQHIECCMVCMCQVLFGSFDVGYVKPSVCMKVCVCPGGCR